MFENVVVGVDGRANGRDAIALACDMRAAHGRLTLAHVNAVDPNLVRDAQYNEISAQMSQKLLLDERNEVSVDADLRHVSARSVGGLHLIAEEVGADLLVVGSCSHAFAGRVFLGNDSHDAVRDAPCAVAVASKGYAATRGVIRLVGVGYDETAESEHALSVARELAAGTTATLSVLEVVSVSSYAYGGLSAASAANAGVALAGMLKDKSARLQSLKGVDGRAVAGEIEQELVVFSNQVDMLVLGSKRVGKVARVLLGSTSEFIAQHAHCPVLIVPRSAHQASVAPDPQPGQRVPA